MNGPRSPALLLVALAGALAGCVVPMPIEAEPIEQNLPPFYITEAVSPPFNQVVEADPEFETVIELRTGPIGDPNPEDRIFYRWFINYQPTGFPFIAEAGPPEGQSLSELLTGSISKRLEPCIELTSNAFVERDLHTVEVVIADRPFIADPDSPTPNQAVPDGAYKVRVVWFIRFDRTKCP